MLVSLGMCFAVPIKNRKVFNACYDNTAPIDSESLGMLDTSSVAGLHNLWQPGSRAARKWRENEIMRKEMERE